VLWWLSIGIEGKVPCVHDTGYMNTLPRRFYFFITSAFQFMFFVAPYPDF